MHRIGALILIAILLGLAWVVLDSGGESTSDAPPPDGPPRPAGTRDFAEPGPEPAAPEPGAPVSISGHVLAPGGGRAAGARVRPVALGEAWWPSDPQPRPEVRADATGRFTLRGLEPGYYRVEARTDHGRGYLPVVPVRAEAATVVVVRMAPIASIRGVVVTEAGVPVAGARVSADLGGVLRSIQAEAAYEDEDRSGQFEAVTDHDGSFRLGDLPVGQYEIRVESEGHAPRRVPAVNAPVEGIRIEVLDTFTVWGRVDWEGEKAPASIRLSVEPLGLVTTVDTAEHPAPFRIAGVTRGEQTFRAVAPDYGMVEAKVPVQPGTGTGPIHLTLERGTQVWLHVRTEEREDVAARVDAFRVERGFEDDRLVPVLSFPVEKDGRHRVYLAPGEWVLRGRAPGFCSAGAPARGFAPDEILWVDRSVTWHTLVLVPESAIVGRVTWPSGWPARDIPVEVKGQERVRTDHRGTFRWSGLARDKPVQVRVHRQVQTVTTTAENPVVRADFVLDVTGTGTVRGQVISDENEPVPGATVFFTDGSSVTDLDGRFERRDVTAGTHDLRYFAPGYGLGYRPGVKVEPDRTVEVPMMVLPWRASRVQGRVLGQTDSPVAGARVRVWFPGLTTPLTTRTDAGGWFVQEGPAGVEGLATIQVDAAGIGLGRLTVAARADAEPVEIRLRDAGRMRILFHDRTPGPFRIAVRLDGRLSTGANLLEKEFTVTVPEGVEHVDVSGLPSGRYRAYFRFQGAKLVAKNNRFRIAEGQTAEVGPLTLDR